MRYRRARFAGGTYFFTLNLAERHRPSWWTPSKFSARLSPRSKNGIPSLSTSCDYSGTSACVVDPAARRRGLSIPDAGCSSKPDFHCRSPRRRPEHQPGEQRGTRHLATPLLGTLHSRRNGLCPACKRGQRVMKQSCIALDSFGPSHIHKRGCSLFLAVRQLERIPGQILPCSSLTEACA